MRKKSTTQKIITNLIINTILFLPCSTYATTINLNFTPYLGIDGGVQNTLFKKGYGNNIFNKMLPKAHLFVGAKFNDYFGLEYGYETTTQNRKKTTLYYENDLYLGKKTLPTVNDNMHVDSKIKLSGWRLGVTASYPIDRVSLISYAGIKNSKMKLSSIVYKVNGINFNNYTFNLNKTRLSIGISTIAVGLQYLMSEHFSIRGLVNWENTAEMKVKNQDNITEAKMRNSFNFSIGIVFI